MLGYLATLGFWATDHRRAMPPAPPMNYSPHQLAYFAHQLTRRAAADSMDRMAGALLHGPLIAVEIGLDSLRQACPHFNSWLLRLEQLAA